MLKIFNQWTRIIEIRALLILKIKMLNKIMAAHNKLFVTNRAYFKKNNKMIVKIILIQMR